MKNSQVLEKINELIVEECGRPVKLDSQFKEADLDDLGSIMFFLALEDTFPIFDSTSIERQVVDMQSVSIRDIVHRCRQSLPIE